MSRPAGRVLIPFGTPYLYGLERGVIEIFDCLRPEIDPFFVQSRWVDDRCLPVIRELRRRALLFCLLPDRQGWPRLRWPRSAGHAARMLAAVVKGNVYSAWALGGRDALYVSGLYAALFNVLPAVRCRLTGRSVVHHFHDLGNEGRLLRCWTWLVTDFVHNTEFGYRVIAREHPAIKRKRNVVLPYLIDVNPCGVPATRRVGGEDRLDLFFVGQVSPHKGVDLLLEAFQKIASRYPSAHLHIVGACRDDFAAEFARLIENPQLAGRVTHWGYREDARDLLRSAYLYVHTSPPSRFAESFGRSVVEAMALGVPTVCFASGALQEIVVHGETGLICQESPEALADGLDRFLGDRALRDRCGAQARRRYDERYSPHVVRPMWIEFFASIGSARHRPAGAPSTRRRRDRVAAQPQSHSQNSQ